MGASDDAVPAGTSIYLCGVGWVWCTLLFEVLCVTRDVLQHGDDAKLVTGGSDVRASIILWRKVGVFVHLVDSACNSVYLWSWVFSVVCEH